MQQSLEARCAWMRARQRRNRNAGERALGVPYEDCQVWLRIARRDAYATAFSREMRAKTAFSRNAFPC